MGDTGSRLIQWGPYNPHIRDTPEVVIWDIGAMEILSCSLNWEEQDMKPWFLTGLLNNRPLLWEFPEKMFRRILLVFFWSMVVRLLKSWEVSQDGKNHSSCIHLVSFGLQGLSIWSSITLKTYLMFKFWWIFGGIWLHLQKFSTEWPCSATMVLSFFFCVSFCSVFNSVCIDFIKEKQMSWESFR